MPTNNKHLTEHEFNEIKTLCRQVSGKFKGKQDLMRKATGRSMATVSQINRSENWEDYRRRMKKIEDRRKQREMQLEPVEQEEVVTTTTTVAPVASALEADMQKLVALAQQQVMLLTSINEHLLNLAEQSEPTMDRKRSSIAFWKAH